MTYEIAYRWKELLVYTEGSRKFNFDCGWGVHPPVVYVPTQEIWDQVTPSWMHGRRSEILDRIGRDSRHVIEETDEGYPNPLLNPGLS
ncbi:hypothetical protein [Planotetraspora kaengkrachanensis]|jgi:hypothetical protein|uniref:Uncharacterized protein n=1 Tax=Planotetraspora kaengkrachanensis TaxID=575193 RepID=A0A8J3PS14_9ACTN|nr:hypothetical protein [Planotetraspora kaengkrachanensis]GIG78483.1 hypothetical protein Pka01_16100 [Planotetraspora kaengkrachanensis]